MVSKRLISLVVPCYNESEVFPYLERELASLADRLQEEFDVEIVLVDDGSRDSTWGLIKEFGGRDVRVRGITLSRNFGHQVALTCGYDLSMGDAIVCMDADLQDPPEAVVEMVQKWKEGYDLVQAIRIQRDGETRFKLWTAAAFYRLIRALGANHVTANTGDFRLMSRRALDALGQMREYHRFIRGMVGLVGFRTTDIYYRRRVRKAGTTKYPLRKMLRFASDAIVSFSTVPLKLSFIAAVLLFFVAVGYLGFSTIRHLFWDVPLVPGWSSLILSVVALGASNLISIGILGEYVGRIYEQVKQRPLYFVQETTSMASVPKSLGETNSLEGL
ncbi:MAG: glycosyltransferase family 2 protein [Planctomycetota bacterium]